MGIDFTHITGVATCDHCEEKEIFDIVAEIDTEQDSFSLDGLHETLSGYLDYTISDNDGCTYEWTFDEHNLVTCPRCNESMAEEADKEQKDLVRADLILRRV